VKQVESNPEIASFFANVSKIMFADSQRDYFKEGGVFESKGGKAVFGPDDSGEHLEVFLSSEIDTHLRGVIEGLLKDAGEEIGIGRPHVIEGIQKIGNRKIVDDDGDWDPLRKAFQPPLIINSADGGDGEHKESESGRLDVYLND